MKFNKKSFTAIGCAIAMASVLAVPASADDSIDTSAPGDNLYAVDVWQGKAVSYCDVYVNIRSEASIESDRVGVLLPGCVVEVVGEENGWTKITSGYVKGYIRSDLLVTGEAAKDIYQQQNVLSGNVAAPVLNIRAGRSTDDDITGYYLGGEEITLTDYQDGWFEVQNNGETGYVSGEYIQVLNNPNTAMTLDQYQEYLDEQQAAAEQAAAQMSEEYGEYSDYSADGYAEDGVQYDENGEVIGQDAYSEDVQSYDSQAAEQAAADQLELDSVNQEEAGNVDASDAGDGASQVSTDDLTLLAAIIHCEAGGECRDGKVAVGACIMNRMASSQFPNTISGVVYQAGQFTPASSGALASALANGVDEDCYEAARAALNGENPIGGLLYFHAGGGSGLTIGNQTFY